jgi:Spy/CpxP family protein refolding chaperone
LITARLDLEHYVVVERSLKGVLMKVKILSIVLLAMFGVVNAQTPPADARGGEHRMERLATLLELTDTQKTQVKAILDAEHAKMRAQMQAAQGSGTKPSFEQMRAAHQQIQAETVQQLTPVLTSAQLKKFQVLMEEEHGGRGGRGPHGPPPSGDAPSDSSH